MSLVTVWRCDEQDCCAEAPASTRVAPDGWVVIGGDLTFCGWQCVGDYAFQKVDASGSAADVARDDAYTNAVDVYEYAAKLVRALENMRDDKPLSITVDEMIEEWTTIFSKKFPL